MTAATMPPAASPKVFGEPQLRTDGELLALAFAPDGSLWSVEEPGVLRHWNPNGGHQIEWHSLSDLETLWAFSRDTRVLASASDDLTLWDTSSGHILTALPQPAWVSALGFHPDPSQIASGHDDGIIRLWDISGHQLQLECKHHKRPISAVKISNDGALLAAASEDKTISLWDLTLGKLIGVLRGHTDRIPALVWHPNGKYLVSAGWDTTARVWDVQTLEPVILLNSHSGQVSALAFSEQGDLLACADSSQSIHVWDFGQRKTKFLLKGPQKEIHCLSFSGKAKLLASSGAEVIHLWDTDTGHAIAGAGPRQVTRTSLSLSPDGHHLATNGGGAIGRIWNTQGRIEVARLEETNTLFGLAYSPDGKTLAAAADRHLRLFSMPAGKVQRDLDGPEEAITAVAFSRDGKQIASASNVGTSVWIWNAGDGEPVLLIPDALDGCTIEALAWHPIKPMLAVGGIDWMATGGSNGAVSVWDIANRCEIATFPGGATALAFHPSGEQVASTTLEQSICIWNLGEQQILAELMGHDGPVTSLAYSPDGELLASGGEDRTVRLWNSEGDEIASVELDSQPTALTFSPDGQYLYTGNANTTCCQLKVSDLKRARG